MNRLRVGTRGSDLALAQTRGVCERLRALDAGVHIDEVIVRTSGDEAVERRADADWPVGAFVSAIETALLLGDVDFAVHSYKDLPTSPTVGLVIVAVPEREVAHDVLITVDPIDLHLLPSGMRIGTGSPRRAAQLRRLGDVEIVPLRGNVPTRLARVRTGDLDGIIIAAAGLRRLGVVPVHQLALPLDAFLPAPGQGALAIQTRADHPAIDTLRLLDHSLSRIAVDAERAFLHGISAGCRTAAAAYATVDAGLITLRAQLFSNDAARMVDATETGSEPAALGASAAEKLRRELNRTT